MGKSMERQSKANLAERGSRFLRDINALGAVTFTGAGIVFSEFAAPLFALAAVDAIQALFFHFTKDLAGRKRRGKAQAQTRLTCYYKRVTS